MCVCTSPSLEAVSHCRVFIPHIDSVNHRHNPKYQKKFSDGKLTKYANIKKKSQMAYTMFFAVTSLLMQKVGTDATRFKYKN